MSTGLSRNLVGGVLLDGDKVLLVKRAADRASYPGVWDFAGGHSEDGEDPEQTLIREIGEELGVHPNTFQLLGIVPETTFGLPFYAYSITEWTGVPRNIQPEEHSEVTWVNLSEVHLLDLAGPVL